MVGDLPRLEPFARCDYVGRKRRPLIGLSNQG